MLDHDALQTGINASLKRLPPSSGTSAYDMIYLLTAIGLSSGGSSTVHIYTQTIHRTIQNKQYKEQHNNFGRVWTVPRLGKLYPDICITTEEKAWKTLIPKTGACFLLRLRN